MSRRPVSHSDTIFSMDALGRRIQTVASIDTMGREAMNSDFGYRITVMPYDDIAMKFTYGLRPFMSLQSFNGTGAGYSVVNGTLVMDAGTDPDVKSTVTSREIVRYLPGSQSYCKVTAAFKKGSGLEQWIGPCDGSNGFRLRKSAGNIAGEQADELVFELLKNDSIDEKTTQFSDQEQTTKSQWIDNLDSIEEDTGKEFDIEALNIYKIDYGFLGILPAVLSVYTGFLSGWYPIALLDKTNNANDVTLVNPNLPVVASVSNIGATQNSELRTGSWNAGIYGGWDRTAGTKTTVVNSPETSVAARTDDRARVLLSVLVPATIDVDGSTIQSYITALPIHWQASSTGGTKNIFFDMFINPAIILSDGTPTSMNYSAVEADNSALHEATLATGDVAAFVNRDTNRPVESGLIAKEGSVEKETDHHKIRLHPGEELVLTGYSTGAFTGSTLVSLFEFF